jgi:hypothetical protein
MVFVKKLVLDVLKPHRPNALEFCQSLAAAAECRVHLMVTEMDEKTETLRITIEGEAIDFDAVQASIDQLGGSLHSIDEVEVDNQR